MKLLLDTHIFLWYISADAKLPFRFRQEIQNPANEVFFSVASVWEVVIKHSIGKLVLPDSPASYLPLQREAHFISSLLVDELTMPYLSQLPHHHRDPFDRILVSQAHQHGLTLVTVDPLVMVYDVSLLSTA